jgi:glycosyltransferase involved in cell wall biosynthesis
MALGASEPASSPLLSVVVPVYGCVDSLPELVQRVVSAAVEADCVAEVVLVDDCSPDDSWSTIESLASSRSDVVGVRLSRNFGQHAAITAGLATCKGQKVVVMDCDLQDPPELIPEMLRLAVEYDVVLGCRQGNYQSHTRLALARFYSRLVSIMAGTQFDPTIGTFSLIDRKVVEAFLKLGELDRHYVFSILWLGFKQTTIDFQRQTRSVGTTSYTFRRRLGHAVHGIMFQNTRFLSLVVFTGFTTATLGGVFGFYTIVRRLTASALPGWTSTVSLILFVFGTLITVQGVVGLYIGRIFQEVKGRPIYLIDHVIGTSKFNAE